MYIFLFVFVSIFIIFFYIFSFDFFSNDDVIEKITNYEIDHENNDVLKINHNINKNNEIKTDSCENNSINSNYAKGKEERGIFKLECHNSVCNDEKGNTEQIESGIFYEKYKQSNVIMFFDDIEGFEMDINFRVKPQEIGYIDLGTKKTKLRSANSSIL